MLVSGSEKPLPEAALLAETAWLRRLARHMVGEEDADDVVQDACVAALERPPRDPQRLRGWLARVVRNAARTRYRDRMRRLKREAQAARHEAGDGGVDVVARAETQQRVVSAVLALDEPYRTTVLLRFFDDLPPRRVAERMGVPVATVHTRVRRGLDQLRARLGERGRSWALVLLPLLPREGKLGALLTAGGAVMSKKAAVLGVAALLALSVGGVIWLSRTGGPERGRDLALASRGGGGEEAPEPGGGAVAAVEGRVRLSGRVVDADGNGVPGARVDVVPGVKDRYPDGVQPREVARRRWDRLLNPAAPRASTACDAEGRFELSTDTEPGDSLVVRAAGYVVETERSISLLRSAVGIEIQLTRQKALRIRVVDEKGEVVAGARVTLLGGLAPAVATTEADGRVDFGAAPGIAVFVEHEGHMPVWRGWNEKQEDVEVRLQAPRVIEGVVLAAANRAPVAGASVHVDLSIPCFATTDEKGRFRMECGDLTWWPAPAVIVDAGREGCASVPVADLPPNPLEIVLRPTMTLEGKLAGSMPLEGLRVFAIQPGLPWRDARADATGAFRIEDAVADLPVRVVFDPWDPSYEEKGDLCVDAPFEPWTGYATIEIVRKAVLAGHVVDERGEPVEGARVGFHFDKYFVGYSVEGVGFTGLGSGDVYTDREGWFRIDGVGTRKPTSRQPGVGFMPVLLRVSAPGFVWRKEGPFSLEPGEERTDLLFRLDRGLSITGRVVTEDGAPLPVVKVRVYQQGASDQDRHSGWATIDGEGRYRIDGLPPGSYGVYAGADDFQPVGQQGVAAGTEAPPLVLRRGAAIEGIVVDEAGDPVAGAYVCAWNASAQRNADSSSNAEGRFRIPQLEPGTYDVTAGVTGRLWEKETGVVAPASDLRFVLRRGLSIRGRIVGPDGVALAHVNVNAERVRWDSNRPGCSGQGNTDKDGRFELTGLSEGEFRLTFENRKEDGNVLPPLMGVVAGTEILVRAESGAFIEGKIVDREGNGIRVRVNAFALDPDGYTPDGGASKEDGSFRLGPLKGARFTLIAGGWGATGGFAADVEAGATDVKIVTGRGEVVAGRVVDKDGNPAAANVAIFHGKLGQIWSLFTEDGRFRVEGLPPGPYFLAATPRNAYVAYEAWRDTNYRGPPGTKVEAGTLDVVLTVK